MLKLSYYESTLKSQVVKMSCTRRSMLRSTYYVLFLERVRDVDERDERFFNNFSDYTPTDKDYKRNELIILNIENFAYNSQVEDIISDSTINFIKQFKIDINLGLDILFAQFSRLNVIFAKCLNGYKMRSHNLIGVKPPIISIIDDVKHLINQYDNLDENKTIYYVSNQLDRLSKVCPGVSDEIKFDLLIKSSNALFDVYEYDVGKLRDNEYWTSILLFDSKKKYIGSINADIKDEEISRKVDNEYKTIIEGKAVGIVGIKGSLYSIVDRQCGKGEHNLAGKILEAVKMYAIRNECKFIYVRGPIGRMPEILDDLGCESKSGKKAIRGKPTYGGMPYYCTIYNIDGLPKIFSNVSLKEITTL